MANTSSAKKAQRVAKRRAVFNARRKKASKDAVKAMAKALAGKSAEAQKLLPAFQKALDKAVKGRTMHANTAARMKSRVAKRIGALSK